MNRLAVHAGLGLAACFVLALGACGGDEKRAQTPSSRAQVTSKTTVTSAPMKEATKQVSPSIAVSEDILEACKLHFSDVAKAPKFDFDQSDLLADDYDVLAQVGRCLSTGPLRGRSVQLVGRADPRGTQQYNMALGARRAHSVASYLGQIGIDPAQVRETSRGELDAAGRDEATWQIDRRVDIVLDP